MTQSFLTLKCWFWAWEKITQISFVLPKDDCPRVAPDQSELGKGWGQMHTRRQLNSECGDTQLTKGLNALLFFEIMKCPFSLYSKSWPQDFHNSTHQHNITTECNDLYQNASQIIKLFDAKGNKIERVNVEPYRPFLLITNVVLHSPQTTDTRERQCRYVLLGHRKSRPAVEILLWGKYTSGAATRSC